MKKKVAVLGATGSIGKSTLDVIARDPDSFEVVLLTAHSKAEELKLLQVKYPKALCVLTNKENPDAKNAIIELCPDITINGISGAAGLEPSIAAIEAGSDLALANKETIVMAGELVIKLAKEKNVKIIPVDSEHSAIFHLIKAFVQQHPAPSPIIKEIILTASGGPFRNYPPEQIEKVTLQDALAHPTWNMGTKITIDSASMANKGLEVIEAVKLFNLPTDKIKTVIHPQSIVHSMIRLSNGTIYAQLSKPDMRNPIADALYYPEVSSPCAEPLNFDNLSLSFEKPDTKKFPMLNLAYKAAGIGGLYPAVYNAANEEAVAAFVENKCGFPDISKITDYVLNKDWKTAYTSLEEVLKADKKARLEAINFLNKMR